MARVYLDTLPKQGGRIYLDGKPSNYSPSGKNNTNVPSFLRPLAEKMTSVGNWAVDDKKMPLHMNWTDKIDNPIGKFAAAIPETIANIPAHFIQSKLGMYAGGPPKNFRDAGSRLKTQLGRELELGLDVGSLMAGGGMAKEGVQQGLKQFIRPGLLSRMGTGAIRGAGQGALYGGGYGAVDSFKNDQPLLSTMAKGMGMGAILGGGIGGISPAIGAAFKKPGLVSSLERKSPENMSNMELAELMKGEAPRPKVRTNPLTGLPITEDIVNAAIKDSPTADAVKTMSGPMKYVTSGETILRKFGKAGNAVADLMKINERLKTNYKGTYQQLLDKYVSPIKDPESWARIDRALKNPGWKKALSTKEQAAFDAIDKIRKSFGDVARREGMTVVGPKGEKMPFPQDSETFVHGLYSKKTITSAEFKKAWIAREMEKGTGAMDAEKAFKRWSEDRMTRRGSFEYSKNNLEGVPGAETNPYTIWTHYVDEASRRLAEVQTFGQEAQKIKPLFDKLATDGFDSSLAQQVYDSMYSTGEKNKLADALLKFNITTKLSLGFFINTTQNVNTIADLGFKPVAKTIWRYISDPKARESMKDIAFLADTYDQSLLAAETDSIKKGGVLDFALWAFKKSEHMNRWLAANAGEDAAKGLYTKLRTAKGELKGVLGEEMYQTLATDRTSGAVVRQMERLGLDVRKILQSDTPEQFTQDLATAAYNAVENTQFKINAMTVPPSWRSDWGRVLTQFKSFSFMQTKFVRDAILKEAGRGNIAPLARFVLMAPIAYSIASYARDVVAMKNDTIRQALGLPPIKQTPEEVIAKAVASGKTPEEADSEWKNTQYADTFSNLLRMSGTLPADVLNNLMYMEKVNNNEYSTTMTKMLTAAGNVGGPTMGNAANAIKMGVQSGEIQKENLRERPENQIDPYEYPVGNFAAPMVPYIGPALKNAAFAKYPKRQREEFRDALTEAVKAGDAQAIQQILQSNPTKNGLNVLREVMKTVQEEKMLENMAPKDREMYQNIKKKKTELNYLPIL